MQITSMPRQPNCVGTYLSAIRLKSAFRKRPRNAGFIRQGHPNLASNSLTLARFRKMNLPARLSAQKETRLLPSQLVGLAPLFIKAHHLRIPLIPGQPSQDVLRRAPSAGVGQVAVEAHVNTLLRPVLVPGAVEQENVLLHAR